MSAPTPVAPVAVRHLSGTRGRVGRWLGTGDHLLGGLRSLVGAFPAIITDVGGPDEQLAAARAGLPDGPARAEAVAVRSRRAGAPVTCAPGPPTVAGRRALVRFERARGQHAVEIVRADPTLLTELHVGSWFVAGWRARAARRVALALRLPAAGLPPRLAADVAFWRGVRTAATPGEWRRLTVGYVVLCYHRLAGLGRPGQERWDVAPAAFRRQLRVLSLLGWRTLTPEQMQAFADEPSRSLPRRRYVVTVDDGFVDASDELMHATRLRPQMFAVTTSVGGRAEWFGDEALSPWPDLRRLQDAGGVLGSHARHHHRLAELDDARVVDEVSGSLAELRRQVAVPVPLFAYPHGSHDERVVSAVRDAGYAFAYTTQTGRNGAGTDRCCLRRIEPKIWDSTPSFLWRVLTGEPPVARWEHARERRWRRDQAAVTAARPAARP